MFSAEYPERRATVPRGLPLVFAFRGANDAGSLTSQIEDYMWERYELIEIVRFNTDALLDYRARRPMMTFDEDHFVDYSPQELTLAYGRDELGSPFLLLSGFEPDYRWDEFIDAVLVLIHEFEVSVTAWAHAVPMPVPHTRPIRMTVSGTRDDLIEARSIWKPVTKLPATVGHVLEYRLHSLGEEVVGFALLVPHYLSGTEYPDALLTALDSLMAATGLIFATDEIRELARSFQSQVDMQIADNRETLEMVRGIEIRYDSYMEDQTLRSPLVSEDGSIPTADQIASQLERFLAEQRENPDVDGAGSDPDQSPDDEN